MADYGPPGNPLQPSQSPLQPPAVRPGISLDLDLGRILQRIERPDLTGQMTGVASSMVASIGYNAATSELIVQFLSGRVYRYSGVPIDVYDGLMAAPSKGQFMRSEVIGSFSF